VAFIVSCVGEPLQRNVVLLSRREKYAVVYDG
jgi:hypothetical protein